MIEIEMDAVMNEYVLQALGSAFDEPDSRLKLKDQQVRAKERAVIAILETMIASGSVRHRYNANRKVEEFRSSESLVRHWKRDFPHVAQIVDPTETIIVKIRGKRSRFADKNDILPFRPN